MKSLLKMRLESMSWTLERQKGHSQKQQRRWSLGQSGSSGQIVFGNPTKNKFHYNKRKSKQCLFLRVINFNFDLFLCIFSIVEHKLITRKNKNKLILDLRVIKINFSISFWTYLRLSNTISLHVKVKTNRFFKICIQFRFQFHFLGTFWTVDKSILIINRKYLRTIAQ